MGEFGVGDVKDFSVFGEAAAEFRVFAIEEKAFVETFDGAEHEACPHYLGDFGGLEGFADQARGHPVGAEEAGVREELFEKKLFAGDGPEGEWVAGGLLEFGIGVEEFSASRDDLGTIEGFGESGDRARMGEAVGV